MITVTLPVVIWGAMFGLLTYLILFTLVFVGALSSSDKIANLSFSGTYKCVFWFAAIGSFITTLMFLYG